jgi:hemolysin activation/secretion protein
MLTKFKIEVDGFKTKIYADGQEIKGVKSYTLSHYAGEVPTLILEFPVKEIEVSGEASIEDAKKKSNKIEVNLEIKDYEGTKVKLEELAQLAEKVKQCAV